MSQKKTIFEDLIPSGETFVVLKDLDEYGITPGSIFDCIDNNLVHKTYTLRFSKEHRGPPIHYTVRRNLLLRWISLGHVKKVSNLWDHLLAV